MCVHRSRCYRRTIFSRVIGFSLQIIVIEYQERCMQNLCTPFLLLQENHILNNYRFFTTSHSQTVTANGVYRMFVHSSRCYMRTIFSIIIGCQLKIIVIQQRERCVQNVCTPFLLLHENHVFNIYRFFTPNHSHRVTGTLYTECVYTVPVAR